MKFKWDKKYLYWGLTAFAVIAAGVLLFLILTNIGAIGGAVGSVLSILKPVLVGVAFAYLFNPILKRMELPVFRRWGQKLFPKDEHKAERFVRVMGIILTMIIVILIIFVLLWMLLPKLVEGLKSVAADLPSYYSRGRQFILDSFPDDSSMQATLLNAYDNLSSYVTSFFQEDLLTKMSSFMNAIFTSIYSVVVELANVLIGLIVSVYLLFGKERFIAICKKLIYSIFSTKKATNIVAALHDSNKIFIGFIGGKVIDSLIIGVISYVIFSIFGMPHRELISITIGVTNIIPFFGPFIGAIPSAILILLADPSKFFTFVLLILLIQQFDGNILGPKILGDATGLDSFWVIVSILVFGGMFGFIGMVTGVPLFAVIYIYIKHRVEERLRRKDLPVSTAEFEEISYIEPETNRAVPLEEVERDKRYESEVFKTFAGQQGLKKRKSAAKKKFLRKKDPDA